MRSVTYVPPSIHPSGPRELGLGRRPNLRSGPGVPPPGFLTQQTTNDEWYIYWACGEVFQDPDRDHIRNGPFFGGLDWAYQAFQQSLGLSGKTAIDFLIYLPGELIGFRIQTELYHVFVDPAKNAYDTAQYLELSRYITMRDLNSQDFVSDASGESAVRLVVEALGGRSRLPVAARARRTHIGSRY